MARAFHFPVLAVICVLILGLVSSANAEMGNGTVVAGAGLRSARCTYTWWSNCRLNTKQYITRTGYSSEMSVSKCANYCAEDRYCYSFVISPRSTPNGATGSCSLWKDRKPKRKYQRGSYCGILKC